MKLPLNLSAALAVALVISFTEGLLLPSIAYRLATWGVEPWLIGLNAAMPAAGILLFSLIIPQLVQRFGLPKLLSVAVLVSCTVIGCYALLPIFWLWFVLRCINGMVMGTVYTGAEIWVNLLATQQNRGRLLAVLGSLMALGFSLGALLLGGHGTGLVDPRPDTGVTWGVGETAVFWLCAAMLALTLIPLLAAWRVAPRLEPAPDQGRLSVLDWLPLRLAPALFIAPFMFGGVEDVILVLMPKAIVDLGHAREVVAYMAGALAVGNILLEVTLGWASDRLGRRRIILLCGYLVAGALAAIWFGLYWLPLLYAGCFVLGGALAGMYSISLAALGDQFSRAALVTANARFVSLFGIGALLLAPTAGMAMTVLAVTGLMLMLLLLAGGCLLLLQRAPRTQFTISPDTKPLST